MKKIALLAGLLVLFVLLPVAASAVGNISVNSTPSGATVYVDNVNKGMTPIVIKNIINGSYDIVIHKDGYRNYTTTVTVTNNQTTNVSAILVLYPTAPPTISTITPAYGFNNSMVSITNLSGTGFSSGATVKITKAGQTNISASEVSVNATKIACNFDITGKPAGYWNVVVTNPDGQSATRTDGFEIKNALATATLSSITPNTGVVNSTVTITDLAGTNFLGTATIRLRRTGYNDIPGTVTTQTSTKITGTFDLNGRTPGSYEVCVLNDGINPVCALVFAITAQNEANNSISFYSIPSGAKVIINTNFQGYTPLIIRPVPNGTYQIILQYAGYADWSQNITVNGDAKTVNVTLSASPATDSSINFISVPSGSKVFLGSMYRGDTPLTLYNITQGSYAVLVQKAGYQDWTDSINVTYGNRTYVVARLTAEAVGTTAITTVPTTTTTTVKTTIKSTAKVPTPWPSDTPAPASPVGIGVILGAIGTIFIVFRKS
jgi:hypothetical protein